MRKGSSANSLRLTDKARLGHIPGHHFFANETYFHPLLLAYNLVN